MRLANGIGTVYKLSGNRRNPYIVRKTTGWEIDEESGKALSIETINEHIEVDRPKEA